MLKSFEMDWCYVQTLFRILVINKVIWSVEFIDETTLCHSTEKPELNVPIASIHPAAGHNAQVPVAGGSDTQALEDIEAAIAVASHQLGLLPAVAFQSRVAQLAQLMDTHQTVSIKYRSNLPASNQLFLYLGGCAP